MSSKRLQLGFVASCIFLIFIVLSFSGGVNITSFKKNYVNSVVVSYTVVGNECVRNIEYAMKYGKPITNFYGMKDLLVQIKEKNAEVEFANISLPNGRIIYDIDGSLNGKNIPEKLTEKLDFSRTVEKKEFISALYEGKYHVFLPILDKKKEWVATLDIGFDKEIVNSHTAPYIKQTVKNLLYIMGIATIGVGLIFFKISTLKKMDKMEKKKVILILLSISCSAQIFYGILSINLFKEMYIHTITENTSSTVQIIQKHIESVVEKGITYNNLYGIEDWMKKIIDSVPEIESILINDENNDELYKVSKNNISISKVIQSEYSYNRILRKDNSGESAQIQVILSEKYMNNKIINITLDVLTILIISTFLMVELGMFFWFFISLQIKKALTPLALLESAYSGERKGQLIRTLAFIFIFASDMSISFIPLVVKELNTSILRINKEVLIGLPLTVEMLSASLFTIWAGHMVDKKGWRTTFYTGLGAILIGTMGSGIAWNAVQFIISRGIVGLGYGIAWTSMNSFVAASPTERERNQGFSGLIAGIFAGSNCGVVLGAMLVESFSFSFVFFIAVLILLIAGIFAISFMSKIQTMDHETMRNKVQEKKQTEWKNFFRNQDVFLFFLFIIIPSSITYMFLGYEFPVFLKSIDASQSDVGRGFLIYGMCIIYLGPFLIKVLDKYMNAKQIMIFSSLLSGLALLLFWCKGNFFVAFIVVLIMGIADSFGYTAQTTYFVNLNAVEGLGKGKAIGTYGTIRKIGQALGASVFGWSMILGVSQGVGVIGVSYIGAIVLFLILSKKK